MKKFIILILFLFFIQLNSEAKDYAKMHLKQMQKNQEYLLENTFLDNKISKNEKINIDIKDPKLIKLVGYEDISNSKMNAKLEKDNKEYLKISKYLASSKLNEYHMQAYGEDFYRVYRIAEKIIRANGLDYVNWRISIDSKNVINAFNSETNKITVNAGILDTFKDNDDALAFAIAHEFAHGILGHSKRQAKYDAKVSRAWRIRNYTAYQLAKKRAYKASREMEFEADIEGAKLVIKAGYDLVRAKEVIAFINTLYYADEINSTHPDTSKRLDNFEQNKKYFIETEWKKQGVYNIYKSSVLKCEKSSNRSSIVIKKGEQIGNAKYYQLETPEELYLRYGYKAYLNNEFKDSIKYFKKYLKYNKGNYAVYLYISYAYDYLYKLTNKSKYLEQSQKYSDYALTVSKKAKSFL